MAEDGAQVWPLVGDFAASYEPEEEVFHPSFTEPLARPDTLVLVAEEGVSVVGYLLASCHGTLFANGPVAWVEELMVTRDTRESGVGRALMAAAEQWARSVPCAHLALASRRAGPFYQAATTRRRRISARPSHRPRPGSPPTPGAPTRAVVRAGSTDAVSCDLTTQGRPRRGLLSAIRDWPPALPTPPRAGAARDPLTPASHRRRNRR